MQNGLTTKLVVKPELEEVNQSGFSDLVMPLSSRREMIGGFIIQRNTNSSLMLKNRLMVASAGLVVFIYLYFNFTFEKR